MRDLSGTGQVYRFTLSQLLKSNANRITLLLMVLLAAVSMPLTALMCGETPEVSDTSSLTAVRLENRAAPMLFKARAMCALMAGCLRAALCSA